MRDDVVEAAALRPAPLDIAFAILHRLAGVYCLALGVGYWVRLVGVHEGPLWRFDLMPPEWQVAAVALAALYPFAGIGLWMMASWGPVIWFLCAASEAVMYLGMSEIFGRRDLLLAAHLSVAALYLAFRIAIIFRNNARRA